MADQADFNHLWTMKSTPAISGDDDEWGEFVAPPQSNGFHSIPASKQANPLGISENHRQKGPLPLSIFGKMEKEEDEKGFDHVGGSLVIEGLRKTVDLGVGIGDGGLHDSDREMDGGVGLGFGFGFGFDGSGLDLKMDRGLGERGEVIDDDRGDDDDDDDGWEFKGAFDVSGRGAGTGAVLPEVMTSGVKQGTFLVVENNSEFSHSSNGFDDWFSASGAGFDKSSVSNHGWNFEWTAIAHNGSTALPVSGAKDIGKENGISSNSVDDNDNFDEHGDFIVANSEVGTTHQESPNTSHTKSTESHLSNGKEEQTAAPKDTSDQNLLNWKVQDFPSKVENGNGALPLSLFSDGIVDYVDHHQDILIQKLPSNPKFGISSQGSGISIHDLVSTLYSEVLPNGQVTHTSSAIPGTVPDETVAQTSQMLATSMENGDGFLDDDSWEFKFASSEAAVTQQPSNPEQGVAQQLSTKPSSILACVDLYEKLRDELAWNIDAGNSNDGNAGDIDGVQEANKVLKDGVLSHEVQPGEELPRESRLHEILELLRAPEFQVLEAEYLLSEKLQLAQKNQKSAVYLLQHVQMVLKVLTLASEEKQSAYLSTWARIVAVCAEELTNGSLIWKQAFDYNVHGQLMSDTRGQRHIQALGEIYRVVQLLRSSAELYKPWILLNSANVLGLIPLLDECTTLWSDSGLEERLENLSEVVETKNCILIKGLLESIKHIRDMGVLSMLDLDFTAPASFCQMTLLPLEILSGKGVDDDMISVSFLNMRNRRSYPSDADMAKTWIHPPNCKPVDKGQGSKSFCFRQSPNGLEVVLWNERLYFLSVANLWANLVSSEPPQLPRLCG
ncbi:hypothetical protein AKJ16_DCAP07967 [Drosera capensis]